MRHDVDRIQKSAPDTARIEQKLGIKATYYFRMSDNTLQSKIMREIEDMGHEVGYHYEVLVTTAKGDQEKAMKLFEYELSEFGKICDIKTICQHGNPLSKYNEFDLWKTYNFREFGINGEAYLSVDAKVNYFSDTGRTWKKRDLQNPKPDKRGEIVLGTTDKMIEPSNNPVKNVEIDWEALAESWVKLYEADYGHFNTFCVRTGY